MAILISAKIPRSGKIVVFGITTDAPGTTGYPPLAQLTGVGLTPPTLYDNGVPVTLGPATWGDGTNGQGFLDSTVGYYITSGPIAAGHSVTFDAPAALLTSNSLTTAAVTGGPATNFSGLAHGTPEGAWGHMPPLPTTDLIPVGWSAGQQQIEANSVYWFGKDKGLLCPGWGVLSGSSTLVYDDNGYPSTWTNPSSTVLACGAWSPAGTTGLANDKGYANAIGIWTTYHVDHAYGTSDQKSVMLSHGSNSNAYVTISLVSTTIIDGDIIQQKWNVVYSNSNPTNWQTYLQIEVSAPSNTGGSTTWTISHPCAPSIPGNPYVVTPKAIDGTAAAVPDFTKPYAIDDNVTAAWITSGSIGPAFLRVMESFGGAFPWDNRIFICDLVDIAKSTWQGFTTYTATAGYVRKFSTDGTLTWQTTRVYGASGAFLTPDTTTYNLGLTLTAGSNIATLTSGTPQLCGSSVVGVTGAGLLPGTLLAHFSGSTVILDIPATGTGASTVTFQNPGYLPIAAADNGFFVNGGHGDGWAVFQLRFATPHQFVTGHVVQITAPNGSNVAFTNGLGTIDASSFGAFNTRIWVNDAYTIGFSFFIGGTGSSFTTINSTTEYDFTGLSGGGWLVTMSATSNPSGVPDEFMAAACTSIGADYWVNFEDFATDRMIAARAQRIIAYGGPDLKVRLEYRNELWNFGDPEYLAGLHHLGLAILGGYLTTGTTWLHYYTALNGSQVPFCDQGYATGTYVLCAGYTQLIFKNAWIAAGASGTRITNLIGTGFSQQPVTQEVSGAIQLWGIPCNYVVFALISTPNYNSIVAALNVSGGNWPVDAYLDFITSRWRSNYYIQTAFAQHNSYIAEGWGQPSNPLPVSWGGSGSSLPGGGYSVAYTYLDSSNNETTTSSGESAGFGISNGQVITALMPPLPPWVASINLYLGASDHTVYRLAGNYLRSTAQNTPLTISSYNPAAQAPPTTNGAAGSAGIPPDLATYEGLPSSMGSQGLALSTWGALEHDCRAHPTMRDLMFAYCGTLQIGEQSTGVGPAWVNLFEYYYPASWVDGNNQYNNYETLTSQAQVPGPGLSNSYATAQGWAGTSTPSVTPDGADHNGGAPRIGTWNVPPINESPGAMGVLDFLSGLSPTPTPTSSRRFLIGFGPHH